MNQEGLLFAMLLVLLYLMNNKSSFGESCNDNIRGHLPGSNLY